MDTPEPRPLPAHEDEPVSPLAEDVPPYESPRVLTLQGEELLRELGPVQGCSFNHSVVGC